MHRFLVIALGILAGWFLFVRPPSALSIVQGTRVDMEAGTLIHKRVIFSADWKATEPYRGTLRYLERSHNRRVPVITHDAAVATGDFANPDVVTIEAVGGGNFVWRSKIKPEGTLIFLHLIPKDRQVLKALGRLVVGENVTLDGYFEARGNGKIEGSDGSYLRLNHGNHKFVLLTAANRSLDD